MQCYLYGEQGKAPGCKRSVRRCAPKLIQASYIWTCPTSAWINERAPGTAAIKANAPRGQDLLVTRFLFGDEIFLHSVKYVKHRAKLGRDVWRIQKNNKWQSNNGETPDPPLTPLKKRGGSTGKEQSPTKAKGKQTTSNSPGVCSTTTGKVHPLIYHLSQCSK